MTVGHVIVVAGILFTIGMMGVLARRNILVVLLSVELMLNATALAFCGFSRLVGNFDGQIMVFFIIAVAAAEVAVGLAMVIALFRLRLTVNVDRVDLLKG
ncbi:MAG: NADH-quinone oxidoreductase subunit NuoK [Planctomycetota bacterium]